MTLGVKCHLKSLISNIFNFINCQLKIKTSYPIAQRLFAMRRYGGPYPCICKEAVSGFEPMTNKSPRHNFTAAPGLALCQLKKNKK